jgi:hypothetical protein
VRDTQSVAAIVSVLRQVHGDEIARVLLTDGLSLAALIDALLCSLLKNSDDQAGAWRRRLHCHAGLRIAIASQIYL